MPDNPNEPLPRIEIVDGQPVLHDPMAAAAIRAVGKHNCRATLEANADRVAHFLVRIRELGRHNGDTVIVIVNVDEPSGGGADLAEMLMPGHDWDQYRRQGQIPFARGLASWPGIHQFLELFDLEAAAQLLELSATDEFAVVVVDHGVAEVFPASTVS